MFRKLTSLSLVAMLTLGLPALAQNDATGDSPQPNTGVNQLDLGEPVNDGPQLGERYSKSKTGDWDLACIKTEAEVDPCSLLQILTDETGVAVAEMSLFRLRDGGQAVAGATVIVPLETLLTAKLMISVDGAPGKQYNYAFCNPIGCVAQIGLTQADIDTFKRGKVATVTLVPAPAPDQVINLPMSLTGFSAGYELVDVVAN